jgi:RNA-directed DNA polymerase
VISVLSEMWQEFDQYGENLSANLTDLHARVQSEQYRAQPSKRAWIPKSDGRRRPLGIAAVEDKIVQMATVWVLNAIYEQDFVNFSYGFRPGRGQHDAMDAPWVGITQRKSGGRPAMVLQRRAQKSSAPALVGGGAG